MIQTQRAPCPPPDADASLLWIAVVPCTLTIDANKTIEVRAGNTLALNAAALEESELLTGGLFALESCGALVPRMRLH